MRLCKLSPKHAYFICPLVPSTYSYNLHFSTNPKTPADLRAQYNALLESLHLDPSAKSSVSVVKDATKVSPERIGRGIESLVAYGTFRGTSDGQFLPKDPGEMEWQASGGFAKALKAKGVKSIVVGDLTEEWYVYSLSDPVNGPEDLEENLRRYYPDATVKRLLSSYGKLPAGAAKDAYARLYGRILSDGQGTEFWSRLHRQF